MWIFSTKGFISVVKNRDAVGPSDALLVRARVREDLEDFASFANVTVETAPPTNDYPFRALASKEGVARYLAARVEDINFDSFKDKIAETDVYRAHVYARVWKVLRGLQLAKRLAWHKAGAAEEEARP